MRTLAKGMACLATGLFVSASAQAAITVQALGTAAPPATLGGKQMTPAIDDTSAVFGTVTSAPLTASKNVLFSPGVSHRSIGQGWASWSHGYTGDVYFLTAGDLTMTFDQNDLSAFYFYAEPNNFGVFPISVTATDDAGNSQTVQQNPDGSSGATGWGISTSAGTKILTITVSNPGGGAAGFAVGEFGWAKTIPGPGALALLGAAGLVSRRRRRA